MHIATRAAVAGILAGAVACGSASGTATISGVVHDGTMAAAGVKLSMSGRAATSDAAGQFALAVPARAGSLGIETAGGRASVNFGALAAGMHVDVVVNVSGDSAELESAEAEFSGAITAIALPNLTIAGKTVVTSSDTEVHPGTLADLKVGERVHVEGALQADGTILAREIQAGDDESDEEEIEGVVQSVTPPKLQIAGRTVDTDASTKIVRGGDLIHLADVAVGDRAHVRGSLESDGSTVLARVIVIAPGFRPHAEIDGTIDSITAPDHLRVSGLTVVVDAHTTIVQDDTALAFGDLKVGEHVLVRGVPQADGSILAVVIRVAPAEPPPGEIEIRGSITALGAGSITVGATVVAVTASTRIEAGDHALTLADLKVGDLVEVEAEIGAGGAVSANGIEVVAE